MEAAVRVAVAQMRMTRSVATNVSRICSFVDEARRSRARLVVFPECATTGYTADSPSRTSPAELREAERTIAAACAEANVAAVVGTPHHRGDDEFAGSSGGGGGGGGPQWYNSATVISRDGQVVGRQHKMQLVPTDTPWAVGGSRLGVFHLNDVGPIAVRREAGRQPPSSTAPHIISTSRQRTAPPAVLHLPRPTTTPPCSRVRVDPARVPSR